VDYFVYVLPSFIFLCLVGLIHSVIVKFPETRILAADAMIRVAVNTMPRGTRERKALSKAVIGYVKELS
jgi:hypothetical protein